MPRLLFEKTGNAVWISHLDLMRLFQRAFKRAGLPLKHTQGFNPRPSVSIALPLSVGVASQCELLDFDLVGETVPCDEITQRLNACLIEGVRVRETYEGGRKLRELALLRCQINLCYDGGVPEDATAKITELLSRGSLNVPKKTKNGIQEQDIIPMLREYTLERAGERELDLEAVICCQNPTLNPMQLVEAVRIFLPELTPDHAKCCRLELYDGQQTIFR